MSIYNEVFKPFLVTHHFTTLIKELTQNLDFIYNPRWGIMSVKINIFFYMLHNIWIFSEVVKYSRSQSYFVLILAYWSWTTLYTRYNLQTYQGNKNLIHSYIRKNREKTWFQDILSKEIYLEGRYLSTINLTVVEGIYH